MAKGISLILGVHNHQPVDNWDHVIEDAYVKCYQPFLDVLEAHPTIKMSIHYTGYLLDWLEARHPELITQLNRLIAKHQVELFSGAYYEPILAIIPDSDKVGQIRKLSQRIETLTGQSPQGLWLAERVWEPHLASSIAQAGIRYLFLDDSHFQAVGLSEDELWGRYTSEEQGKTVDIFPVNKTLRYRIPYASPQEVIDYLGQIATERGERTAVYFDDGEKFGVWPGSFRSVYREKWLDRFFTALEKNADWIHTVTPAEAVSKTPPLGRIYLPTASYSEMMEWALPATHRNAYTQGQKETPELYHRFLRGGFWRNFLVKYPEANNIHKKMLYVSEKIHRLIQQKDSSTHPDVVEALDELWKGQSNDIFWHGVFGGLYLTNLRTANYQHLLRAETLADQQLQNQSDFFAVVERDFDCDGQIEVLVESSAQNLYLNPAQGGCLFELDYRAKNFNLLDTLARRYEPYHDQLMPCETISKDSNSSRQKNLAQHLHYDWHRRVSLLDHFLGPETDIHQLAQSRYSEQGDFVDQPYQVLLHGQTITLSRDGHVWQDNERLPIRVEKQLIITSPNKAETRIRYTISNHSKTLVKLWFAPEFNVNLLAGDAPDRYYYIPEAEQAFSKHHDDSISSDTTLKSSLGRASAASSTLTKAPPKLRSKKLISKDSLRDVFGIGLRDEWLGIDYHLIWNRVGDVWRFPVETISQSEGGIEKVYQSSAVFPHWKFELPVGQQWDVEITQRITSPA